MSAIWNRSREKGEKGVNELTFLFLDPSNRKQPVGRLFENREG